MTYALTRNATFSITDARHIASKVGADLRNLSAVYGQPPLGVLDLYIEEVALLLKAGYLRTVDFGFKSGEVWKLRLRYTVTAGGNLRDDNPGRLPYNAPVSGLPFYSYLRYSSSFYALTYEEQRQFEATLPLVRNGADEPVVAGGVYGTSATYARNGQGLGRDIVAAFD